MANILIAEDDQFLQKAYLTKFSKEGIDVDIASNGVEAMEYLGKRTPSIILLDLIMPKKDGFAVLTEIKKSEKWKNVPVIVMSNLGQKEDIDKAKSLGASDYFIKSDMQLSDLVNKIRPYIKV